MNRVAHGFSLVEMMTVLAVSSILLASAVPLGSFWIVSANLSSTHGEMSHGLGKAIATALRNEHALDNDQPAAALCLSDSSELSVLQANSSETPNCSAGTGTSIWTSSIPDAVDVTENGNAVSCMCFNPYGLLTSNACSGCTTQTVITVISGDREEVLHVR